MILGKLWTASSSSFASDRASVPTGGPQRGLAAPDC